MLRAAMETRVQTRTTLDKQADYSDWIVVEFAAKSKLSSNLSFRKEAGALHGEASLEAAVEGWAHWQSVLALAWVHAQSVQISCLR